MLYMKYSGRSQIPFNLMQSLSAAFTLHKLQGLYMLTTFNVLRQHQAQEGPPF